MVVWKTFESTPSKPLCKPICDRQTPVHNDHNVDQVMGYLDPNFRPTSFNVKCKPGSRFKKTMKDRGSTKVQCVETSPGVLVWEISGATPLCNPICTSQTPIQNDPTVHSVSPSRSLGDPPRSSQVSCKKGFEQFGHGPSRTLAHASIQCIGTSPGVLVWKILGATPLCDPIRDRQMV